MSADLDEIDALISGDASGMPQFIAGAEATHALKASIAWHLDAHAHAGPVIVLAPAGRSR